jgi:hypothetical protein
VARKRKKRWKEWKVSDPCDGMEVNEVYEHRFVGKRSTSFTIFDADCYCIELGKRFHPVSIMKKVSRVNRERSLNINGYKDRTNGR